MGHVGQFGLRTDKGRGEEPGAFSLDLALT